MNTKYWEEEIETMSRKKLQELQLQRLKKTINIAANAPDYKKVFQEHGITPESIQSLDDIRKLPFTTTADMRANYPFGLVAGTMKEDQVMGVENNYSLASHHVFGIAGASDMLFSPLDKAKEGMKIYLTDKNKVYTYVISEVKVVQPTEVAVVDDTPGKSEVTLVTCTDAEATQRTIVKGELKSQVDFDKASSDIIEAFNKSYNQFQS